MTQKDYLTSMIIMLWAFFAPIHTFAVMIGALVILDLITGVWKALKLREPITSHRLRQTVTKGCAYMIALIASFILDNFLGSGVMVSRTTGGLIAIVEAKSLFENLHAITNINIWEALLKKLQPPK